MKYTAPLFFTLSSASVISELPSWSAWKLKYNKVYHPHEEATRYQTFVKSYNFVKQHNERFLQGKETFFTAVNKFADWTDEEWADLQDPEENEYDTETKDSLAAPSLGTVSYGCGHTYKFRVNDNEDHCPDCVQIQDGSSTQLIFDWTDPDKNKLNKSLVTAVKDQGSCSASWAFSATGVLEGQMCLNGDYDCSTWEGASEQNCIDCMYCGETQPPITSEICSSGCAGGATENCWYYAWKQIGIDSETGYPFTSGQSGAHNQCAYNPDYNIFAANEYIEKNEVCVKVGRASELGMMKAINDVGPIKSSVYANNREFKFYSGGIYQIDSCPPGQVTTKLLITGYGQDISDDVANPVDFWVLKNSWGTDWGMGGYMNFRRHYHEREFDAYGMCAISKFPYFTRISTTTSAPALENGWIEKA